MGKAPLRTAVFRLYLSVFREHDVVLLLASYGTANRSIEGVFGLKQGTRHYGLVESEGEHGHHQCNSNGGHHHSPSGNPHTAQGSELTVA